MSIIMLTQIGDVSDFKNTGKLAGLDGIVLKVSQSNDTKGTYGNIIATCHTHTIA